MRILTGIVSLLLLAGAPGVTAEETAKASILKKGQRVAVVGDSITEQKLYSKYIELYLTACLPQLELRVVQLGWGGETAPGFAGRMNNDLLPFAPDVVTTCYGMNDGGYGPFKEDTGKRYANAMADIVGRLKKSGATVVVGSPGAVDTKYFGKGNADASKVYNETLGKLRDLARALAEKEQLPFADVFSPMHSGMEKAKAALGDAYDVCGKDGVHPGPNGHLIMAYAFLKAMGIDGEIGTIVVDAKAGGAQGSDGHRVLGSEGGKIEIESARYPFCFTGDDKSPGGTRSILPYVPFNADLNRFVLIVRNLDGAKAKVTWGSASQTFSKEELEKGVNLADRFFDNPFSEPFRKLDGMIAAKQNFETAMIKQTINQFPRLVDAMGKDKAVEASVEALRKQMIETHDRLNASVRTALLPVKHSITIAVEK